ncbi:MAG: trehalose-phosphatase [Pseudolabrys sp.]
MSDDAAASFAGLDPGATAFLFDVDGTLIDIGPAPFEVDVPDTLRAALSRLLDLSDGALALVSGRPIRDLDRLFDPLTLPAVGGHGAETRLHTGERARRIADLPQSLRDYLIAAVAPDPRLGYEDKGYSLALHFRKAPEHERHLVSHVEKGLAIYPDEKLEILPGKAMIEVKRPGVTKGEAVRALMTQAPFTGRRPVFIGDDVTDQSVFSVMPELGGASYSVGRSFDGVPHVFATPSDVRRALAGLAGAGR